MLCSGTGSAVVMVDLDTVKPGLLHYDIGDALRSGCNRAGEETTDLDAVRFDLDLAAAMLRSYLLEAGAVLNGHDGEYLHDAIRLLPFELGLGFFTDDLKATSISRSVAHVTIQSLPWCSFASPRASRPRRPRSAL